MNCVNMKIIMKMRHFEQVPINVLSGKQIVQAPGSVARMKEESAQSMM